MKEDDFLSHDINKKKLYKADKPPVLFKPGELVSVQCDDSYSGLAVVIYNERCTEGMQGHYHLAIPDFIIDISEPSFEFLTVPAKNVGKTEKPTFKDISELGNFT